MRTRVLIYFNTPLDADGRSWALAREMFAQIGRNDLIAGGDQEFGWSLWFEEGDQSLPLIQQRLEELQSRAGFRWGRRIEIEYNDRELRSAPLLNMSVTTAERGRGGPTYGTLFDLSNACPTCGTGACQVSSLILTRSQFPKRGSIFQTATAEYLVAEKVRDHLELAGVEGLELRQAIAQDDGPVPWYQLLASYVLPMMSQRTTGIKHKEVFPQPCSNCQRDGHYHTAEEPVNIVYDRDELALEAIPDAAYSWECFGRSVKRQILKECHFAAPLLLVKPRVFEVLRSAKVRGLKFVPVTIEPT